MTRSFGDYVASTVGVIDEPEILHHEITKCTILNNYRKQIYGNCIRWAMGVYYRIASFKHSEPIFYSK